MVGGVGGGAGRLHYTYLDKHIRELIIDGFVQGGVDMRTGQSIYTYSYLMEILPTLLHPGGKEALVIGLGAGIIPPVYQARGVNTHIVDIDPNVIDIASNYFGFRLKEHTSIADARYFLANTGKKFDYIILDVFNGDITPGYLISQEALQLIRQHLTPNGVLAFNLAGSIKDRTYMTASVIKTLESVFDQVAIYPTFDYTSPDDSGAGNLSVMAYQGNPRQFKVEDARNFNIHPSALPEVMSSLTRRFAFPENTPAIILTDNYNPVDFFDNWMRAMMRQHILETTDWDILVSSNGHHTPNTLQYSG